MKRQIKATTDFNEYDEEEDYFDIYYNEDTDKFVAQGDTVTFEDEKLEELPKLIKAWNENLHDNDKEYVGYEIEDNIDYDLADVKDESEYYGEFIIHQYIEPIC